MNRSCLVLIAFALGGCAASGASAPTQRAAPPTQVQDNGSEVRVQLGAVEPGPVVQVNGPPEQAWAALPQVYAALGLRPDHVDPATRTYGVQRVTQTRIGERRTRDYVRCGNDGAGPSAATGYRIQLSIVTRLAPSAGGKTDVTTAVGGWATSVEGGSTGAIRCASNGDLEQQIATLLAARLAS